MASQFLVPVRLEVGYAIPFAGGEVDVAGVGTVVVVVGTAPAGSSSVAHFWPREALASFKESLVERTSWDEVAGSIALKRGSNVNVKSEPDGRGNITVN